MKKVLKEILYKNKFYLLIEAVFIVVQIFLLALPSKILGEIINYLYNIELYKNQIYRSIVVFAGIYILILLARLIWKQLDFKIYLKILKSLKNTMFAKLLKVKLKDLKKVKNGRIMSYFVSDTKQVASGIQKLISTSLRIIVNFVIIILFMNETSNFKFTLIVIIPVVITMIIAISLRNRVSNSFKASQKSFTQLSEFVQESTDSIRTTKAFAGEDIKEKEFEEKNKEVKSNNLNVIKNQNLLDICISTGFGLSFAIILGYGSMLVINKQMSIGDLVAFNGYLAILEGPVRWVPWLIARVKKLKVSYKRLDDFMKLNEEKIQIIDRNKYEALKGDIQIKNLTYNYPGSIERVLDNVSININHGENIGIIGVIGSGKTTLMNLLLKLYDVEPGKIFLDGIDINEIPIKRIRENICYITQDNFLFSATLKENINLFKDEYKDQEIEESTKNAMIYEEISNMQEGIYSIIGEKGIDLSGGQKQRVVISRAFLNKSNIVVFDDTFSALDNKTEQHVLNNIKELTKNKTCIIISNRISDIKECDKILVLDQGVIIEQGNHESLLKNKGKYYEFFENQAHKAEFEVLA